MPAYIGRVQHSSRHEEHHGRGSHCETFDHGADIGVRGYGATREAAFEQAARALTSIVTNPDDVRPETTVELSCRPCSDDDILLMDWLNAVIYEMTTRGLLFSRFEVQANDGGLRARACGEPVDVQRHQPAVEPKGATCTELQVRRNRDGFWRAQCVVDV